MKSKKIATLMVLVSIMFSNMHYASASYPDAPSDVVALKSEISKSLVIVGWQNKKYVGFAGNYNISQESKDAGINSIIVTSLSAVSNNFDLFQSCFAKNAVKEASIEIANRKYIGTCSNFNSGGGDFATLRTSVNLPSVDLYDNFIPSIGEWVLVAHYVDGFGLTLTESRIKLVNLENYVLAIEKFEPKSSQSGLVFNALGNFVGMMTSNGIGVVPLEYFKVHGAPLQCQTKGQNSGTITNCTENRELVWSKNNPGINSSISTVNSGENSATLIDKFNDLKSQFNEKVAECEKLNTSYGSDLQLKSYDNFLKIQCHIYDKDYQNLQSDYSRLKPSDTANLQNVISDMESLVDLIAETENEIDGVLSEISTLFASKIDSGNNIKRLTEKSKMLSKQLNMLPIDSRNILMRTNEIKKFYSLASELRIYISLIDSFEISSYINDLPSLQSRLQEISDTVPAESLESIEESWKSIQTLIPKYVCQKGNLAQLLVGSKCKSGYKKVQVK